MEDLLLNIVKESNGPKLLTLKQSAQEAHDLLNSQCSGLLRSPAHELRAACFKPLRLALESKRTKLVSLALSGLHKIVRDERFQAGNEPEDDSLWLPAQLLHATSSMLGHCEDTQVHVLRVFLGLACGASWALNGRLVMLLLGRCGEAYELGTQPVRAAAQAAGSQTVTAFCTFLDEECQDILQQQQKHRNAGNSSSIVYSQTSAVACFNEVIPVMQYICSRLEESRACTKVNDSAVFLLECLLTLVSTLPRTVHSNTHFTTFLWQRFCPALLSLLGTPGDPSTQGLTTNQAKIVYSIGIQLVRLVGSEPALRPVLEALFHRMLLLPGPVRRLEPLRAVRELLRSPGRLADLLLLKNGTQRHAGDDMAIIRLIMDSIEESSQCNEPAVMLASVECVVALLSSLDALCRGEGISHEAAQAANARYACLEQADYKGPLTYQSLARLPKPYRDVVANLRYHSDSDSSGIDGGGRGGDRHTDDGATESDTSGATEGPEDRATDSDDSILDEHSFLSSQELQRIQKLPKAVLHLGRAGIDECNVDIERHNARHFVKTLQNILLPNLLSLRSSIQVDGILQEFASKCCQHNSAQSFEIKTIMNADGIYLATYSALLLNLRLIQLGHYARGGAGSAKIPLTESQFVDEVYGSGALVYLSATWLSELYQQVLATSLLEQAGYDPQSGQQYALINLLTDVGGLGPNQLLTDWQRLERVHCSPAEPSSEVEAGIKLSRRVLTCCWDSMVTVLSGAIEEEAAPGGALPFGDKASTLGRLLPRRAKRLQYKRRVRDHLVTASLDGLHKAASLSNVLRLQRRSSSILALLAAAACRQPAGARLHAAHALSLDVLLSKGLALGSHCAPCWQHVFAACVHVAKLEHALFSKAGAAHMLMVAQNANTVVTSTTTTTDKLNLTFNLTQEHEETCVDVYSFLQSSAPPPLGSGGGGAYGETSIGDIVNKSGAHNTANGLLSNVDAAKVCCLLSQQVDSLFHDAALKLNLPCLCAFLEELCSSSQRQLFARADEGPRRARSWWRRELGPEQRPVATLLLHRIGDVTLKCIRAGRPLVHTMRVWAIVGPHFMEAACHKDRAVSKKAIACIHDAVTALLNEQVELPHFHFNEALLKPFENLLCLELCDFDVQDQIVACLCEFVEANRTEICSGWRPLFGTLRVANTSNQNAAAIADVFKIFLSTDNTLVFANAALDYILCLLTHIRGTGAGAVADPDTEDGADSKTKRSTDSPPAKASADKAAGGAATGAAGGASSFSFLDYLDNDGNKYEKEPAPIDLCRESLKYLESCVSILEMMYSMPKCPTFNMSHRVQIDMEPQLVDAVLPSSGDGADGEPHVSTYKVLSTKQDLESCERHNLTLARLDKPSGVLKVWYVLLEGLASNTIICARKNQALALETLFKLLKELLVCPGESFGLYCINHLLLPMVQSWLRQNAKMQRAWHNIGPNFKHCCGMATELLVEYLQHVQGPRRAHSSSAAAVPPTSDKSYFGCSVAVGENADEGEGQGEEGEEATTGAENPALTLALKQLLLILIECVVQPNESVARLGASCIRHVMSSAGQQLTGAQWDVMVAAIHGACALSLSPLRQLTLAFKPNSDSFYGDLATVKVAARKDCTVEENAKLYQLARQVFAMSVQRDCAKCAAAGVGGGGDCGCDAAVPVDERSYVFLLYPPDLASSLNAELYTVRVPFRSLVVGILAHQMLTQTVSSALLQNLNHVTPIFNILQIHNYSLRGILNKVNARHVSTLLQCMQLSSSRAKEFDARPGLKFLMQKVGNLGRAANLYAQANTSDVVQIIVLIELCLDGVERCALSADRVRALLCGQEQQVRTACSADLGYVEHFLLRLKELWNSLIHTYMNLSLNIGNGQLAEPYEECEQPASPQQLQPPSPPSPPSSPPAPTPPATPPSQPTDVAKPFKFADFINDPVSCGIDSEQGPAAAVKEDANLDSSTITTTTDSALNQQARIDKDTELKVEAMMEQYRKRKPYHAMPSRINPFSEQGTGPVSPPPPPPPPPPQQPSPLSSSSSSSPPPPPPPPPQPVPAEIQQQRMFSIRKDAECYKVTYVETVEACLELLGSLPAERIRPLVLVLEDGVRLLTMAPNDKIAQSAQTLLHRLLA